MSSPSIKFPCSTFSESGSLSSLIALANVALVPPLSLYFISMVRALELGSSSYREHIILPISVISNFFVRRATFVQMLAIPVAMLGSSSGCKSAGGCCCGIPTKIKAKQFNDGQRLIEGEVATLMVALTVVVKLGQVGNLSHEN